MILEILFLILMASIFQTYILYPVFMRFLSIFFKENDCNITLRDFPTVEIIFAAYNEEVVIQQKIESCFTTNYPKEKLSVRVGSDNSSDDTNSIIESLLPKFSSLYFKSFEKRTGKSGILNVLVKESKVDLLILTDANIIFEKDTIPQLVKTLLHNKAGACGGSIIYSQSPKKGIAAQEYTYLNFENQLKLAESNIFKSAIGLEGGCYIIKRKLFPAIPTSYFMEDFFVSLHVLQQKERVVFSEKAICYEDVSIHGKEEYKRRVRISIGNFQNLNHYKSLIFSRFFPVGFAFLSHKILRWLTPFMLLFLLLIGILLSYQGLIYTLFTNFCLLFLLLGLFGIVFSHKEWPKYLKYPGHFLYMNLALLKGFFVYLKGVKNNVWQPTPRNRK